MSAHDKREALHALQGRAQRAREGCGCGDCDPAAYETRMRDHLTTPPPRTCLAAAILVSAELRELAIQVGRAVDDFEGFHDGARCCRDGALAERCAHGRLGN